MLFGMVSLHITGNKMDAAWMTRVTVSDVAEFFNFSVNKDVQVMPAVYQTVKVGQAHCPSTVHAVQVALTHAGVFVESTCQGPLFELADNIVTVLNQVGVTLVHHGYQDFGAFLMGTGGRAGASSGGDVEEKKGDSSTAAQPSASALVHRLCSTFDAFRDIHTIRGERVWLLKKAQQLAADLYLRFKVCCSHLSCGLCGTRRCS